MISEDDKRRICEISEQYHVSRVILFGSSLDSTKESRDIDIGVEGVLPKDFFRYYADLMFSVSKPIDVIEIDKKSKFSDLILREGQFIYG